jgi:hypothetical protein
MSIDIADRSCFVYCLLGLWAFCQAVLPLTYVVATSSWSCHELRPQHVIRILNYSMELSPSWEASQFSASQKIPCLLRNTKVHYHIHNCSQPTPMLNQPNPVQIPTSHSLKIHLIIILPYTPGSPQWSVSLRFSHQNSIHASLLPHACYMPNTTHSSRFYHIHNIGWGVQIMKLLMNTHTAFYYFKILNLCPQFLRF